MEKHTFTLWLRSEVVAARCALLSLYEQQDKMKYIDGPQLEKEYMEKIGTYEENVIREEIECELLQKKQQMIQIAINRREPIDEEAIDAQIDDYREKMVKEAVGEKPPQEYANLSSEQNEELQALYHEIVKKYHPQMHPEVTEVHRQLFKKAQEAYRRKDLAALKLIHEMLSETEEDGVSLELLLDFIKGTSVGTKDEAEKIEFETDYAVAAFIYGAFKPTVEEGAIREEWVRYRQITEMLLKEMEGMRLEFPYNAEEMLSAPEKIEEYRRELDHRLHTAETERKRRTKEIQMMIESVSNHG